MQKASNSAEIPINLLRPHDKAPQIGRRKQERRHRLTVLEARSLDQGAGSSAFS